MRVCIIGGVLMISGHNILLGLFMVVGTTLVSLVEYKRPSVRSGGEFRYVVRNGGKFHKSDRHSHRIVTSLVVRCSRIYSGNNNPGNSYAILECLRAGNWRQGLKQHTYADFV